GVRAEAEDLTQDVCAALPAKLSAFRGDARFTTWLYRVVVNAAHDRRRRTAAHGKAADGWANYEVNRQAALAEDRDRADWLAQAMGALTEDLRDTATLILAEGLTQAEAASVLDIAEGTVAWRMAEVKKALRALAQSEMTA
ncbi:MAG: RNA polymerase sigma factor, partial [Pseudomonadota bacterium]